MSMWFEYCPKQTQISPFISLNYEIWGAHIKSWHFNFYINLVLTKYNVKVLHANSSLWKAWAQLLFNSVSHKDEVWTIWTQFVTWLHCLKTHEHESAHQTHCKKTNQKKKLFIYIYIQYPAWERLWKMTWGCPNS